MSHRSGFNGYLPAAIAPASNSSVTPAPGQSGVYDHFSPRAQALPSFWREDEDEQVTRVRQQPVAARRETILPAQPLQSGRPLWQVALQLRGDELSRLWRRNAIHLAGRIYVWSDHSQQWVQLYSSAEMQSAMSLPFAQPEYSAGSRLGASVSPGQPSALSVEPVDLTRYAHRLIPLRLTRGLAVGLAASLLTVVALAAWLPRKQATVSVQPRQAVEQPRAQEAKAVGTPRSDVVSVESLPLVTASASKTEHHAMASKPGLIGDNTKKMVAPAGASFNPILARQALWRAASQAGRCSSGEVAGSVIVTYEPSGLVSNVALNSLAGDLSGSACIVKAFQSAHVAPFQGSRVVVRKSFARKG
jgi:hypothetical protein